MVTLAIAAVLAVLAAPSIRDFLIRNQMANISNEFAGSIMRARNEAASKNTCVSMCMSATAGGSATPSCKTTGDPDWQQGWILFLNEACDSSVTTPALDDIIAARNSSGSQYTLMASTGSTPPKKLMFTPSGRLNALAGANMFVLDINGADSDTSFKYGSNICLDKMGRTRIIPYSQNSCS
ncbi:GspH/FimT family protein [Ramlibacter sp. H39-3-26]|nr:GspH/FimT family protein [Ramlibacter sp. H39-3-26]MDF1483655.1 GspH/FimT family protein [Ramlibacter sp. H39-3-26]